MNDPIDRMSAKDIFHAICVVGPILTEDSISEEKRNEIHKLLGISHLVESIMLAKNIKTVREWFKQSF